jgi:hypothetical protein
LTAFPKRFTAFPKRLTAFQKRFTAFQKWSRTFEQRCVDRSCPVAYGRLTVY